MTTATVQRLTGSELQEKLGSEPGVIIDVRTPGEFAGGHLIEALNYDFLGGVFAEKMADLDKDATYYLYCASGNRSGQSAQMMVKAGFTNVYNAGGFHELATAGLPTE